MIEIEDVQKKFKAIDVEIQGMTPLLMNNIENSEVLVEGEKGITVSSKKKVYDNAEEAEKSAYWVEDETGRMLCVPARCIFAMMLNSAKPFKNKGQRTSVATTMAGAFRVEPERISLGTDKYAIDVQAVVVPSSGSRVKRARARVDKWKLSFRLIYYESYLAPDVLLQVLSDAGFKVGLLDFRPQRKGPYGTFIVTKFTEVE